MILTATLLLAIWPSWFRKMAPIHSLFLFFGLILLILSPFATSRAIFPEIYNGSFILPEDLKVLEDRELVKRDLVYTKTPRSGRLPLYDITPPVDYPTQAQMVEAAIDTTALASSQNAIYFYTVSLYTKQIRRASTDGTLESDGWRCHQDCQEILQM